MFNSYYNQGYPQYPQPYSNIQPQSQLQQNMPLQQQIQPQMQSQMQSSLTNKIYVSGIDEVKTRQQPLSSSFIYLHNDKPIAYEKRVDNSGQYTITICRLEQIDDDSDNQQKQIDMSQYALKSDIVALESAIRDLQSKIIKGE